MTSVSLYTPLAFAELLLIIKKRRDLLACHVCTLTLASQCHLFTFPKPSSTFLMVSYLISVLLLFILFYLRWNQIENKKKNFSFVPLTFLPFYLTICFEVGRAIWGTRTTTKKLIIMQPLYIELSLQL